MNALTETKKSRFLSKEDIEDGGRKVIIDVLRKENVAPFGKKAEEKCVLYFVDDTKPLILNTTNAKRIANVLGTAESDHWHGKEIELYHDPNVEFGGELIGGIRVRSIDELAF